MKLNFKQYVVNDNYEKKLITTSEELLIFFIKEYLYFKLLLKSKIIPNLLNSLEGRSNTLTIKIEKLLIFFTFLIVYPWNYICIVDLRLLFGLLVNTFCFFF